MNNDEEGNVEVLLDDDELLNAFSGDAFKAYMNDIGKYPVATIKSNSKYYEAYCNGDLSARDMLINTNLRLVIVIAKRYAKYMKNMQPLDIIHEGNLGLLAAIERYDSSKGAFSTFVGKYIKGYILRAISTKGQVVRKSNDLQEKIRKYRNLLAKYEQENKPVPDNAELCRLLGVTEKRLKEIISGSNMAIVSINKSVGDEEDTELEDFIADPHSNRYDEVINDMITHDLYVVLHEVLTPMQYFVIYHRILSENEISLEEIGRCFSISRERVRQIEEKAKKILERYIPTDKESFNNILKKIKNREGSKFDLIKHEPLSINQVIKYMYIKDNLTLREQEYFKLRYLSKYNYQESEIIQILMFEKEEYLELVNSLKEKLNKLLSDIRKFKSFKKQFIKTYGTHVFDVYLNDYAKVVNYQKLSQEYENMTYDELKEKFGDVWDTLSKDEEELLYNFFAVPTVKNIHPDLIEQEINLVKFDYKAKKVNVPINKLYQTYLDHLDDFNEEQRLYLECYIFKLRKNSELKEKYPNTILYHKGDFFIYQLERYYYNIFNMWDNKFTRENYIAVKEKYADKLTEKRIELLDLYYGVNGPALSIKEIAKMYNENYRKMIDKVSGAYDYAMKLYTRGSFFIDVDKKLYSQYLSYDYDFTPETRKLLTYYLVDNLSYQEIAVKTGLNTYNISNIITEGIRRIEFYRYNMIEKRLMISKEEFNEVCQMFKSNLSQQEIDISYDRFVLGIANTDINSKYNLPKHKVDNIVKKFRGLYFSFKTKDMTLEKEEIIQEICRKKFETILTLDEKIYLSLFCGIANEFNIEGKEFTKNEISIILGLNLKQSEKLYNNAITNIKLRKEGLLKPDYVYFTGEELQRLINDPHLPISEKERYIICSLFELNHYPYKNFENLGKVYGEGDKSIKRRYQRAILTIYKYLNKEIEGKIDYEIDILPVLKYFGLSDRTYIEDYYRDKMSFDDIAKKHKTSKMNVWHLINRIKTDIYYFLNGKTVKKFDYDYYLHVVNNDDLPFYGNKELACQIFDKFCGMVGDRKLSSTEIVKELNLDIDPQLISKLVADLMLSVCKYREGFTKVKEFTYEEVKDYYERNKDNILAYRMKFYNNYFKMIKRNNVRGAGVKMSYYVIHDLIKNKYPDYFDLTKATKEEVLDIIKQYDKKILRRIRNELMAIFQIPLRVLMNGKDINHVWRILDKLEQKKLKLESKPITKKKV